MTRKRQAEAPAVPTVTSYRGFRSKGRWVVERDNVAFRYSKYETSEISHDGPWRWGPRQQFSTLLAWALLMDVLDDENLVADLVAEFDHQFVSRFHWSGWMMSAQNIRAACERIARELRPDNPRKPR